MLMRSRVRLRRRSMALGVGRPPRASDCDPKRAGTQWPPAVRPPWKETCQCTLASPPSQPRPSELGRHFNKPRPSRRLIRLYVDCE
jgi:hypothetical protein